MFPQGTVVCYVCCTKERVLAVVQQCEQYRTIVYKHGATEVAHDRASVNCLTAMRATSPPPGPRETPVQLAEVLPPRVYGSCSPLCMPSFSHVFCSLRALRLWTARKGLRSVDPKAFR